MGDSHHLTTLPFPNAVSWSNQGILVSTAEGSDNDQDDQDDQDPPPQVPEWSDYPFRFRTRVNDLATEWWLVSLDCVILVAKHTVSGHFSLDQLADRYLLNESEVNMIIDSVLAERREFTQICRFVAPTYHGPIRIPSPLAENDTPFRDMLENDLPKSAYAFLVRSRWATQSFIHSLNPDSFPWLFAPQAGDQTIFDLHTTWNEGAGYPFWHELSPSGGWNWFKNRVTRNFIIRTLIDSDSGICLGNTNFFYQSIRREPVGNVRTECQKISFVLSWLIVELREFTPGQMNWDNMRLSHIRKVAREYHKIYTFLDTILYMDNEVEQDLMAWVSF